MSSVNENPTDGPPMIPVTCPSKRPKRKRVIKHNPNWRKSYAPRSLNHLQGPEHLAASTLPEGFPPELAFRALAAYSLLRTLSLELRLSPFTPNVFLRALNLPYPSRLLGQVHVALLKVLLPSLNMGYTYRQRGGYAGVVKRRKVDGLRWELRAGDNLTYLDAFSWPLFYDDYAHLTSDILHSYMKDKELHVDYRIFALRNGREDSAQIDDDDENKSENTTIEPEEKESLTKEDDSTSRTSRARFGTLPTRKSKPLSSNGKIQLRKKLPRKPPPSFLLKRKFSKSAEDSTESEKSDNEHSDFDDAEKDIDKDDEYLAKPSKKKTSLSRGNSRVRRLPPGPGFLASDVELGENGMWKPDANAFCGRPAPSMSYLAPNIQTMPSPAAYYPYPFSTPQIGVPRPFLKSQITGNSPLPDPQCAKSAVASEQPHSESNSWKQGDEVLHRSSLEIPLEAKNELINHLCVTSVPKPPWVPPSMAISMPHSYDPPHMMHASQPRAQVMPYEGMDPSFGLVSVPQGSVSASSPSAMMLWPQVLLPAPQGPTTPQRPMYIPKVLAPKFKLEEHKPSGIPVPGSVANTVHDFIFPPKIYEKVAVPIESGGEVISKRSTINDTGNASTGAPFKLHLMEGGQKSCHPTSVRSASLRKSITEEAKIEVGMILDDIIDRLDPKTEQSTHELDQALSLSVKYQSEIQERNHSVDDDDAEVRALLDCTVDKFGHSPENRVEVKLIQDEPIHDVLSLMHSIIERIERKMAKTTSSEIRESVLLDSNKSETHHQEAENKFREPVENENDTNVPFSGNDLWPQFDAIKSMRSGMPYHRLSIEQKLQMMEFLIDELLTVDVIAAEFTRRNRIESCYSYPYGAKPSEHDLEQLENGDECGVCRLEGDLLCCDGCPRSFHRKCLSMSERAELPDGKWLCPECEIVDPANFGTLWGDRKAAVDWFTIDDIETARIISLPEEQRVLLAHSEGVHRCPNKVNNVPEEPLSWQNVLQAEMASTPIYRTASSFAASQDLTSRVLSEFQSPPGMVSQSSTKFLVIHGFVFSKETRNADSATSWENIKRSYTDHGLMSQSHLSQTMQRLGHRAISQWPLNQIPLNPLQVWGTNQSEIVSLASFFKDPDRFDPSRYLSQYRLASLPKLPKACSATRQSSIVNLEYESEYIDTRLLSSLMEADMAQDVSLAAALRTTSLLFNPYRMTTVYMEKLESSLKRAYLLNEFWGMRNKKMKMDTWLVNLRKCQSITKLAKLIVSLVDASHPRAFVDDWNSPPNGRVKSDPMSSQPNPEDKKSYLPIAEDWSAAGEKRVREWQQCSVSSFLSLLASETDQLDGLVDGVCERFRGRTTQRTKKRKFNIPVVSDAWVVSGTSDTTDHKSNSETTHPDARTDGVIHAPVETNEKVAVVVENYTQSQLNANHQRSSIAVCDSRVESSNVMDGDRNDIVANISTEIPIFVDDEVVKRPVKQSSQKKTRRSGRKKITDENGLGTSETMASIIESQRRDRLEELEHFLKMPLEKELHWPVAGRKLFQPAGILASSEVKHLGRSAGIVPGAYVTYSKLYEVGQVAVSHLWRKRVLNSNSLEELLIQVRVLDSYLDKTTISTCEGLMRRAPSWKLGAQKIIECSQRDSGSGAMHYFVVQQGSKKRGCWFSAETVDLSPLLLECERRINEQRQLRSTRLAKLEAKAAEIEQQKRDSIEQEKLAALQAARSSEEAAEKSRLEVETAKISAYRRAEASKLQRELESQRKAKAARVAKHELDAHHSYFSANVGPNQLGGTDDRNSLITRSIKKYKDEQEQIFLEHILQTREMLLQCAKQGVIGVPKKEMNELRRRTFSRLSITNANLRLLGNDDCNDNDVPSLLMKAEGKARASSQETGTNVGSTNRYSTLSNTWRNNYRNELSNHETSGEYTLPFRNRSEESARQQYILQRQEADPRVEAVHGQPFLEQPPLIQHLSAFPAHHQTGRGIYTDTSNVPLTTRNSIGGRNGSNRSHQDENIMLGLQQQFNSHQQLPRQQQYSFQHQQQHHQQMQPQYQQHGLQNYTMNYPQNMQPLLSQQQRLLNHQHSQPFQPSDGMHGGGMYQGSAYAVYPSQPSQASINNLGGIDIGGLDPVVNEGRDPMNYSYSQGHPHHNQYPHRRNPDVWR